MTCPTPSKARYADRAAAQRAAAFIRHDDRGPALSPYLCDCGGWHLTSPKHLTVRIRGALSRKD